MKKPISRRDRQGRGEEPWLARRRPLAGVQGHIGIENTNASESSSARVLDSGVPFTARSAVGPARDKTSSVSPCLRVECLFRVLRPSVDVGINLHILEPTVRVLRLHPGVPSTQRVQDGDRQQPDHIKQREMPPLIRRHGYVGRGCEAFRVRRAVAQEPRRARGRESAGCAAGSRTSAHGQTLRARSRTIRARAPRTASARSSGRASSAGTAAMPDTSVGSEAGCTRAAHLAAPPGMTPDAAKRPQTARVAARPIRRHSRRRPRRIAPDRAERVSGGHHADPRNDRVQHRRPPGRRYQVAGRHRPDR